MDKKRINKKRQNYCIGIGVKIYKPKAEQFCHDLLEIDINRTKSFVNIVMSLGSEVDASNPTSLSKSPFFEYHYSTIGQTMREIGLKLTSSENRKFKRGLYLILKDHIPENEVYKISSDYTTIRKPDSFTLAQRGFVNIPNNRIFTNKSIDIGYYISCVNLGLYDEAHPNAWSLPLDTQRVGLEADKMEFAANQLSYLLRLSDLPFGKSSKVVNAADSGYSVPAYICPLVESFDNLLLIIRLRHGIKVYTPYKGEQSGKGRTKSYSDTPYYLQLGKTRRCFNPKTKEHFDKKVCPIFELPTSEEIDYEIQTSRGRKLIVKLYRWNDLLLRGTQEFKMEDKAFDLICVRFVDKKTKEVVFKNDMYLSVWGKNRHGHSSQETQQDYKHRYDIEGHNRFMKQNLLGDKYQTSEVEHLDAWLWTVQTTFWLLYAASTDTKVHVNPWEKYLPEVKRASESTAPLSAAMTRRGAKHLFSTFDRNPFKPRKSKNGKGRKKGETQTRRKKHRPRRKCITEQNKKQKIEQLE